MKDDYTMIIRGSGSLNGLVFGVKDDKKTSVFNNNVAIAARQAAKLPDNADVTAWPKHTGWHNGGTLAVDLDGYEFFYDLIFFKESEE